MPTLEFLARIAQLERENTALQAQVDALRAERDQHQCPQYTQHHQSRLVQLRRVLDERDALVAAQAQAAPVLAAADAADAVVYCDNVYEMAQRMDRLKAAVAAWRAAREG